MTVIHQQLCSQISLLLRNPLNQGLDTVYKKIENHRLSVNTQTDRESAEIHPVNTNFMSIYRSNSTGNYHFLSVNTKQIRKHGSIG